MTAAVAAGAVLAGLAGVKALEGRLPRAIVRAGILVFVFGPLVGLAYAMWALWQQSLAPVDLVLLVALSVITGLGTSLGYHRLLTHRSFSTTPWLKAAFLAAGAMAVPSAPSTGRRATSSTTPIPTARATRTARPTGFSTPTLAGCSPLARRSASATAAACSTTRSSC
jgi:hypothetical protein